MDIERLKELKNVVVLNSWLSERAKKELTTLIEEAIARQSVKSDIGETSDGYHTFNELYHHRAVLFSSLCFAYKDKAWRARKHYDGTMFGDDWFICGVETPQGQYTYHYHIGEYWDLFDFCKTLNNAPEWDGHQPKDVDRLLSLRQMRSDPCEWCDGNSHKWLSVDPHAIGFDVYPENYHNFCPNCGRKLKENE